MAVWEPDFLFYSMVLLFALQSEWSELLWLLIHCDKVNLYQPLLISLSQSQATEAH